ncbi:MAG: valine--tRNA ligase [Peptoniphilaceae bacterium]|nr:valine--tRNA ligase [Peptoniphilaceae bacterium]MDY3738827.1 valine--tRNA ligase [Peptoniphilaceae bacterium]
MKKIYEPKTFEKKLYKKWEESGYFKSNPNPDKKKYSIVMPPPNVTGILHLGHAINNTIQDILIRYKRMDGYEALWIPGTDHASISTEHKVVNKLLEEGKTKEELGREGFLKECWDWTEKYGNTIRSQLRELGVSCDWSREAFTMDENLTRAVRRVFKKMYDEGLIYKGYRIVNWDSKAKTAISDAEVKYNENEKGHLRYIRYFFENSDEFITIATTRPETIFGDLAVAVNPDDERFKDKIGKNLILPLVGRKIPLIEDSYVDMEYGTGLVKITPSHDPNDFEVGKRHNLGQCVVFNEDGTIKEGYGEFSGLDRLKARALVVEKLKENGNLEKIEDIVHSVGYSERTKEPIEPLVSEQWFVKMKELAKLCIDAYDNNEVTLVPSNMSKTYMDWLNNIKDWTISRQLWWGHRIPVFYTDDGEIIVSEDDPDENGYLNGIHVTQEEDTLDTWFSSALWPFATLGWPEETEDLKYYFPTDVLVTGYDILFFWVIRMIFSSKYNLSQSPFHHVFFTGLIRDKDGRKMSKSLGNGVDPIEVIDKYGADALRFTLVTGTSPGNDSRYDEKKVQASRNFANKLWNASRFVLMNIDENDDVSFDNLDLMIEDKWILKRLNDCVAEERKNLDNYEIGLAAERVENFIWNEYCDWYIEFAKLSLYGEDENRKKTVKKVLIYVLNNMLALLHPFMPFITEEIYGQIPSNTNKMLIIEKFPKFKKEFEYSNESQRIDEAIAAITKIRNQRSELNVKSNVKQNLIIVAKDDEIISMLNSTKSIIKQLSNSKNIEIIKDEREIDNAIKLNFNNFNIYMLLDDLIDYNKEKERIESEIKKYESEVNRSQGKLNNIGFIEKAPEKVVNEEKEKLQNYKDLLQKSKESLKEILDKLND